MARNTQPRLEAEILAKRLCRLAQNIDAATWQAGRDWYPQERAALLAVAEDHGFGFVGTVRMCTAYAALSPQQGPKRNRELLAELLTKADAGTYKNCIGRALAAMAGHTLDADKTSSFARNLAGCQYSVTVDRWAVRACGITAGKMAEGSLTTKQYRIFERAYRLAAKRLDVSPRTLQAAAWIHVRGGTGQ